MDRYLQNVHVFILSGCLVDGMDFARSGKAKGETKKVELGKTVYFLGHK